MKVYHLIVLEVASLRTFRKLVFALPHTQSNSNDMPLSFQSLFYLLSPNQTFEAIESIMATLVWIPFL
jgi:hypothetical protein